MLKNFFKSKNTPDSQAENDKNAPSIKTGAFTITPEILRQLLPIRNFNEEELKIFSFDREAEALNQGSILFKCGDTVDSLIYLLEGSVSMNAEEGVHYEIKAKTPKARFPLCSYKKHTATAIAQTAIQILRVSPSILNKAPPPSVDPLSAKIPEQIKSNPLFQAFCHHYKNEELVIPSLPDIAIKLRKAIENNHSVNDLVKILHMDPAIAAKLIHVANSPLYLSSTPIKNCHDAVVRLGMKATHSLVISHSLKQVFRSLDPYIGFLLKEQWKKSINLASLCYVLAKKNGNIDAEEAMLAGLVCDIGTIPFLYFTENFPKDQWTREEIPKILNYLRGPLGSMVLSRWDFPEELIKIPPICEDWLNNESDKLSLSDIVILAKLHTHIGTPKMDELPAINSTPACGKLKFGQISLEGSLKTLHEAHEQINEAARLIEL